jgi:hypothetical protein
LLRSSLVREAQAHNLYALITWDDGRTGSIHGTPGPTENQREKLTQHSRPGQ